MLFHDPKTFNSYQEISARSDKLIDEDESLVLLGLSGEIGSLLTIAKKYQRDKAAPKQREDSLAEELGDVMWYLAAVCRRKNFKLGDIANRVSRSHTKTSEKVADPPITMLDTIGITQHNPCNPEYLKKLKRLSAAASGVIDPLLSFRLITKKRIVRILYLVVDIARAFKIKLSQAMQSNIQKVFSRWPPTKCFDRLPKFEPKDTPDYEILPNHLEIEIWELNGKHPPVVMQKVNGINIGDRLTDNNQNEDFYRFHDVFHYANAAILHWSPVTRALLKTKRKSLPSLDVNEDGARAALIEEGVSTFTFNIAKLNDDFKDIAEGELSYDLLKMISILVKGYEVERCPMWLWERAILEGYKVFRYLKDKREGKIVINRELRTIEVGPRK